MMGSFQSKLRKKVRQSRWCMIYLEDRKKPQIVLKVKQSLVRGTKR